MKDKKIILASGSPRRKEILEQIGLAFEIVPSTEPEIMLSGMPIEEAVRCVAEQKTFEVSKKVTGDFLIIGADTVVYYDKVYGKPRDEKDAFEILKHLSGKHHQVITGVSVLDNNTLKTESTVEITTVKMRKYSNDEIYSYINTGEPLDKAGAYGIQGLGACLVERIEGCYFNVVGLPINGLVNLLKKFDVFIL
jgi:septum formation protein